VKRLTRRNATFTLALGALGWLLLLAVTWLPGIWPVQPPGPGLVPELLSLLVIMAVRAMAFELYEGAMVSLDSPFYIASAITIGSVRTAWLVAIGLAVDMGVRALLPADGVRRRDRLPFVLYLSGITSALVLLVALAFGVDERSLPGQGMPAHVAIWLVPAMGVALLVLHYALQGTRMRLEGFAPRDVARYMALPGIVAETTLLPLAVVMVIIYDPGSPAAFVLLGATYLLVNFMFNRVHRAGAMLRRRVQELEVLNRMAHAIGSALEQRPIIERVSRETVAAVPEASHFAVGLREGAERGSLHVYLRDSQTLTRHELPRAGIGARVLETGGTVLIEDAGEQGDPSLGEGRLRCLAAAPLVLYGETIGYLVVGSPRPGVFGADHARLLEAIAGQASVAIENARLYELATIDGLTELYVRRYFDGRVQDEWQRGRRFHTSFAVVIMDLDDFKEINDRHGHAAGDRLLREIATVVRNSLRGIDIAARYGGDEFGFVLPRTRLEDARGVAERIRGDVERHAFRWNELVHRVTASVGVAGYPEAGVEDPQQVVHAADEALYRAKAAGKNRVEVAPRPASAEIRPLRAGT
jgi:diguanylate cyclase (GGDEF)-like protein